MILKIKRKKIEYSILIDDDDFVKIHNLHWNITDNGSGNLYVVSFTGSTRKKRQMKYLHRHIMNVVDKNIHIDHINGNSLDNRKENLRICTNAENRLNSKLNKRNRIGFIGVRTRKGINKFAAYVSHKGKFYHLGYYDTAEEAAKIRDIKAKELRGPFVKLNFPESTCITMMST